MAIGKTLYGRLIGVTNKDVVRHDFLDDVYSRMVSVNQDNTTSRIGKWRVYIIFFR